jgi:hypothetical protein
MLTAVHYRFSSFIILHQVIICGNLRIITFKLKLFCNRRSIGQSLLVSGSHLESMTRFLFSVWQLWVSWCGSPSLKRGQVCNLLVQLLLGIARAVTLGSKSCRTHGHILLSHVRLPQPGGPGPCIYMPQEQVGPVVPPGTGFPLCRLLRLAGLWWRYSNLPPHGCLLRIIACCT